MHKITSLQTRVKGWQAYLRRYLLLHPVLGRLV